MGRTAWSIAKERETWLRNILSSQGATKLWRHNLQWARRPMPRLSFQVMANEMLRHNRMESRTYKGK